MPSSGFKTCARSEEHTSELQSHDNLVCRLLLGKKTVLGMGMIHERVLGVRVARWGVQDPLSLHPALLVGPAQLKTSNVRLLCQFFFFLMMTAPPEFSPFPHPVASPY